MTKISKAGQWDSHLETWLRVLENNPAITADMLLAMGLNTAKIKSVASVELTEPLKFTLTMGDRHNELKGQWNPVHGARGYLLEITTPPTEPTSWRQAATVTRCSCTLKGLTTGTTYYVRVRAFGSAGQGPYSAIEMAVAP